VEYLYIPIWRLARHLIEHIIEQYNVAGGMSWPIVVSQLCSMPGHHRYRVQPSYPSSAGGEKG